MDELDILLEELAQNPIKEAGGVTQKTAEKKETTNTSGQVSKVKTPGLPARRAQGPVKNVYSDLPAPVEAELMSPRTATHELDSIMRELLGLDLGISEPGPSSTPPPLVQKSGRGSVKEGKKLNDDKQVRKGDAKSTKAPDPAPERVKPIDAIDDLLGGLSSDMEKMGVRTAAKGHCASCGKCIAGKMITALGQVWHPEHFVCVVCREELSTIGFFEREGKAYCEKDYQHLFSPRCAYCKGPILQNILTAMDHTWHPEHFFCTHCGERFGPDGFLEREGKPYCSRDFYHLFAPKCSGCGEPVRENYLSAANGTWHPDCFVCADCLKPFSEGCFLELDGRPLCSLHYHSRQGTLCGGCGAPISGRCISALDRKFHPEHFVCAFCLRQLSQGVFKEQEGKPYCGACHTKLFL